MSYQPYCTTTHVLGPPHQSSTAHVVIAWVVTVMTAFYMLPWAIAATRNKRNVAPVVLINVFLGWSLVGWVVALVLACVDDKPQVAMVIDYGAVYAPPAAEIGSYRSLGSTDEYRDRYTGGTRP